LAGIIGHGASWFSSDFGQFESFLFLAPFNAVTWGAIFFTTAVLHRPSSVLFPAIFGFVPLALVYAGLVIPSKDALAGVALIIINFFTLIPISVGLLIGLWIERKKQS